MHSREYETKLRGVRIAYVVPGRPRPKQCMRNRVFRFAYLLASILPSNRGAKQHGRRTPCIGRGRARTTLVLGLPHATGKNCARAVRCAYAQKSSRVEALGHSLVATRFIYVNPLSAHIA